MTAADFAPIIQAIIAGIGVAITALIGIYVPRAITALDKWIGLQLTAQQQAAVMQAATTAAGILQTKLDQGVVRIAHIDVNDPAVVNEAQAALARVPQAAAALDKTVPSMAATIVGLVDTSPKPAAVTPLGPPAPTIPFIKGPAA
jgi:hypothetical protein